VAALDLEGIPSAYPLRVLEKVEVVNDEVRDRPFLVTFSPFIPRPRPTTSTSRSSTAAA
jgi:hypothetical protein